MCTCSNFYFLAFLLYGACFVESEKLQCLEKTLVDGFETNGSRNDTCQIESEGQTLLKSDCTLWHYNTGTNDCASLQFSPSVGRSVSGVRLQPLTGIFPNLSLNFSNIEWHYMKYRLQIGDANQKCQSLLFNSTPKSTLNVSFACKVFGEWAVDSDVHLLLDVGRSESDISGHAHFTMKTPKTSSCLDPLDKTVTLQDWCIFVAVDISEKPYLNVYWPAVPGKFNVTKYLVQISNDEPEEVKLSDCPNGYCTRTMFAGYAAREVSVHVKPIHEDCVKSCYSNSPVIKLEFSLPTHIIVMMALAPVLFLVMCVSCIFYLCCIPPKEKLVVLLLYDATTKLHSWVFQRLVQYLEGVCGLRCVEVNRDLPPSEAQNPDKWLREVLDEVDTVVFLASPAPLWDVRHCTYPRVLINALQLIGERRKCKSHDRPGYFLVAVPPYCVNENIPSQLEGAPCFYIPQDLSWLLWAIYNQPCWIPPFKWLAKAYLRLCWCPGPMFAYRHHGTLLAEALEEAVNEKKSKERTPPTPPSERTGFSFFQHPRDDPDTASVPTYYKNIKQALLDDMQSQDISLNNIQPKVVVPDEEHLVHPEGVHLQALEL